MRVTIALLMEESATDHVIDLLNAARDLTKSEYKCYVENKEIARKHLVCEEIHNELAGQSSYRVTCQNVALEPIMFVTKDASCTCEDRITEERMCMHKIKLHGCYLKKLYEERHMR